MDDLSYPVLSCVDQLAAVSQLYQRFFPEDHFPFHVLGNTSPAFYRCQELECNTSTSKVFYLPKEFLVNANQEKELSHWYECDHTSKWSIHNLRWSVFHTHVYQWTEKILVSMWRQSRSHWRICILGKIQSSRSPIADGICPATAAVCCWNLYCCLFRA